MNIKENIKLIFPEISKRDFVSNITILPNLTTSLVLAKQNNLCTDELASKIFLYSINQMGFDINIKEELELINNKKIEDEKNKDSYADYDLKKLMDKEENYE